jgi:hypothetical protein
MESRPRPGVVLAWLILGGLGLGTFMPLQAPPKSRLSRLACVLPLLST